MLIMMRIVAPTATALALIVALSGCSGSGQKETTASSTRTAAASTATPTPTPTPTPAAMSVDEAGKYFLGTVCPVNAASKTLNDALVAQNLDAIHSSSGPLITSAQDAARRLDDRKVIWPEVIDQNDVDSLRDYYFQALPAINTIKESASLEQANAVAFPSDEVSGAASQRIRLRLNLSADTAQGC